MAEVTLTFDELEAGDLPLVCIQCGRQRGVDLVERRFIHRPLFAPSGLIGMALTKRAVASIPLCHAHGGYRLMAHARAWWGLSTIAIGNDRITIGGVHEDFADALRRHRAEGWHSKTDAPRRRLQTGRGPGGGLAALKVLGVVIAAMAVLLVVMASGMFLFMGGAMLWMNRVKLPVGPPPPPTPVPVTSVEPTPESVVVGLLGVAPNAAGPGGLPWALLAVSARKETFHILEDADLDKALADLKSPFPGAVADAAKRLAAATPTAARRQETARALQAALANPFPMAKEAAAEALGKWGTSDDVTALVGMLGEHNPNTRAAAMTALAALKDERGAVALAQRLSDFFDREKARQSLEAMGPVAEPAVAPLLNQGDPPTRVAACGVLKAIGTKASLAALEKTARDPDQNVARAAADAAAAIKGRP